MSDTVAIDALPYYDRGYDEPGVREAAMQLVQEEMQRYRPTKDYLENLPSVGKSKTTKNFNIKFKRKTLKIFKNLKLII